MADQELPDETERLQVNLEDDVRAFLFGRLIGNRMDPKKRALLADQGVDVRRLSKPSYIALKSGCDQPDEDDEVDEEGLEDDEDDEEPSQGCRVGAEGYMVQEDEPVVHLAFKCGDPDHEMHYSVFMPLTVVEMAKAMEAVWPGSVMGALMEQAVQLGRAERVAKELDDEAVERVMRAVELSDKEGAGFDFDEDDTDDEDDENEEEIDDGDFNVENDDLFR